jgi:riboflavin synthase
LALQRRVTVIENENERFKADVSQETLNCSIFGDLSMGDTINLEKALRLNQGIDGHLVSGHVDGQGEVTDKALEGVSMRFRINVAQSLVKYIARKGSITVNGVSLTVNSIKANGFDRDACCNPCRGLNRNGKVSTIGVVILRYHER